MAPYVGATECFVALIISFIVWRLLNYFKISRTRLSYPPGPPGLPFIGNISTLDKPAHLAYRDLSLGCRSDVVRLHGFGVNIIVLDSFQAAVDLLDKRSSIYSDRPTSSMTMWNELVGLGWSFAFQPYDQEWRDARKIAHREFSAEACKKHRPVLIKETHKLLRRFLQSPEDFMDHMSKLVGGEILSIVYDIEALEENDPYLAAAEKIARAAVTILRHGTYLVDFLPILKHVPAWFPGAGFKRDALEWRKSVMDLLNNPYDAFHERRNSMQVIHDCVAKSLLEEVIMSSSDPVYMDRVAKGAMASMYLGGTDTTLSIFWSFILVMVLHPDIQHRAQECVDKVCDGRLPDFDDIGSIPYVDALVRECLRWNPVLALDSAHRCTEDNVYREWVIPEGSVVLANIWAMLHDEETYPCPDEFNPERFLKPSGPDGSEFDIDPSVRDPTQIVFGFGRRICPGRFMAYDSLWVTLTSLLAVFDFTPSLDASGKLVLPSGEYDHGFICHPKPFKCTIKPRSSLHATLITELAT